MKRKVNVLFKIVLAIVIFGCSSDSNEQPSPEPQVKTCGSYPEQSTSKYILPYEIGKTFVIGQGNCSPIGRSHAIGSLDQYSYDILMPIGTNITAARGGIVNKVVENFAENNGTPGQENVIEINHGDGTFGVYFHITHNGSLVSQGEQITQGQLIALSGNTGNSSAPHLHFHVWKVSTTIPTVFKNTIRHPEGLQEGISYTAEPY